MKWMLYTRATREKAKKWRELDLQKICFGVFWNPDQHYRKITLFAKVSDYTQVRTRGRCGVSERMKLLIGS